MVTNPAQAKAALDQAAASLERSKAGVVKASGSTTLNTEKAYRTGTSRRLRGSTGRTA